MKILEIVRYHKYRPMSFNPDNPDPDCPICNKTIGHSITLIVRDEKGDEHEIHSNCFTES